MSTNDLASLLTFAAPPNFVFGVILYPHFEVLDVFGPLEALNQLTRLKGYGDLSLVIIADVARDKLGNLNPVSSATPQFNSHFEQKVVPTHTFEDAPYVDVLLVPGGMLTNDTTQSAVDFIRNRFSHRETKPQYLITVCTGAGVAARAGVLDGLHATTNKHGWKSVTQATGSQNTWWVAMARWVVDGTLKSIWTTSGVSAGTDGMIAWIENVYGKGPANDVVHQMEYFRQRRSDYDPFAAENDDYDVHWVNPPSGV